MVGLGEKSNRIALQNCPSLAHGYYYPTIFLPTPFLQVLFGLFACEDLDTIYERTSIFANNGGQVELCICVEPKPKSTNKILLINHGHGSGANASYIKKMAILGNMNGF